MNVWRLSFYAHSLLIKLGPAESYQLINERESTLHTATVLRSLVTETAQYRVPMWSPAFLIDDEC